MRLFDVLRLEQNARPALVGAGGKTTALFQLGRQYLEPAGCTLAGQRPVPAAWLSATTHLAVEQARLAARHITVRTFADIQSLDPAALAGVTLFTGLPGPDERLAGLPPDLLAHLHEQANAQCLPLIIEADGSRRLPIKAPASYEPALPAWADPVVVVAGLSGLGRRLGVETVHRPERFGELSGLSQGEVVTPAALAAVLSPPQGGLRNIPAGARRVILLNQADTPDRQAAAQGMAQRLLQVYDAVVIAALAPPAGQTAGTAAPGVLATFTPVAGVILAAGGSSRLGQTKQLLDWHGQPFIRQVAQTALAAGLSPVVAVVGAAGAQVAAALHDLPVQIVQNDQWEAGQSTSLQAGLLALPPRVGAAVFLLADQPQIPAGLIQGLLETHSPSLSPLVAPVSDGKRANPVLFDRCTFPELMALVGDTGGRVLFSRYRPTWVPWHDPMAAMDVDTLEDYRRLLERDV